MKEMILKNEVENRKVNRIVETAEIVIENDGVIYIEDEAKGIIIQIERRTRNTIRIEKYDEYHLLERTKAERSILKDIIVDSYKHKRHIQFNLGGCDFTEKLDQVSKLLDYGYFHFKIEKPAYVTMLIDKSRKNLLDIRLQELRNFENGFLDYLEISFTGIQDFINDGYRIIGYGEEVSID